MADDSRFVRLVEAVWRLAPDRVLVRRVWPKGDEDHAADLLGVAALIWVALDEPATMVELADRLTDADQVIASDDLQETLDSLLQTGWVVLADASS